MAQKWNSNTSDVFGDFNSPSRNSSQIQNTSPSNNIHPSTVNDQVHGSQQMMIHPGNSYNVIGSSSNAKESCLRSSDCNIPQNNCQLSVANINSDQQPTDEQGSSKQEEDGQSQNIVMCFVCCSTLLDEKNFYSIRAYMNHSHAPLLVLLVDVLGYKLDDGKLHSQVVCKSCYHLLDIIDELQQTLTESKTDLRTKFFDTIQRFKLKYPRTDKMLKPRCLRCNQMVQSASRKRSKGGRMTKGKGSEECGKGRGRGKVNRNPVEVGTGEGDSISTSQENGVDSEIDVDHVTSESNKFCRVSEGQMSSEAPTNIVFDTDPMFFSPDEKLKVGIARENEGVTSIFLCMYCNARYDNALSLKMHVRVYHMPVLVYDNGQGTAETRYRMGIKLQNTTPNESSTTEKPYACLFCVSAYKLQSSLQFHFRENHSPYKPFQCLECKESFRRTIELSRHRLYRCPLRKPETVQPKR